MPEISPDAPFRTGVTGKYKLLIRSVTPKFDGYEYYLEDAEGIGYKAKSSLHYSEMQLLRCMVSFEVKAARLVVSDVAVCKKQDLAESVPKTKKANPMATKEASKKSAKTALHRPTSQSVMGFGIKKIKRSSCNSGSYLPQYEGDHFHLIYTPMGNKR